MYTAHNGDLILLWPSYSVPNYRETGSGGYVVAVARSTSGRIEGPWKHDEALLMDLNAGHSKLFRNFHGQLFICTHSPDTPHGQERPLFLPVEEFASGLKLI